MSHTPTALLSSLILIGAATVVAAAEPAAPTAGPPADRAWKLVWSDEFDGGAIDATKWIIHPARPWNWPGIPTSPESNNLRLDGQGHCIVELTRDPDGTVRYPGGLVSRFEKAYGYFETKVQFTRQPGWWGAVWLSGHPYACGADTFTSPQEFDIFEDFYKPKTQNDIQHCYHCSFFIKPLPGDQGNTTGLGAAAVLQATKLARTDVLPVS